VRHIYIYILGTLTSNPPESPQDPPAPTTSAPAVAEEEGRREISAGFSATELEEENSGFRRTGKEEEEEELEAEEKGKTRDAAGPLGK